MLLVFVRLHQLNCFTLAGYQCFRCGDGTFSQRSSSYANDVMCKYKCTLVYISLLIAITTSYQCCLGKTGFKFQAPKLVWDVPRKPVNMWLSMTLKGYLTNRVLPGSWLY